MDKAFRIVETIVLVFGMYMLAILVGRLLGEPVWFVILFTITTAIIFILVEVVGITKHG